MSEDKAADQTKPIRVGIGLIRRGGAYLIRRRPEGGPMPGLWEFPGGKCEAGESPEKAAVRECLEETGLRVVPVRLRTKIVHTYPHGHVELSYFDVECKEPAASPDLNAGFVWVAAEELPGLEFPEANAPILAALSRET